MAKTLIIDDDETTLAIFAAAVAEAGHEAVCATTLAQGMELARRGDFDMVYLDVILPDGNGLEALSEFAGVASCPEVIVITGLGDPDSAETAILKGAWDYVEKSPTIRDIKLSLLRALEYRARKKTAIPVKRDRIIGSSPKLEECLRRMAMAARGGASALILGETGVGKDLLARAIHENSARADMPFVTVDCAALQDTLAGSELFGHRKGAFSGAVTAGEGLFQLAHGGTLFLDEVSELDLETQKKLLRVLETGMYRPLGVPREVRGDFRMISASNRDIEAMVRDGLFREDLYFRIRGVTLRLPPLRERRSDMPELVDHFLAATCAKNNLPLKSLSPELMRMLGVYDWPGNIRELSHVVDALASAAPEEELLMPWHLPLELRAALIRSKVGGTAKKAEEFSRAGAASTPPDWKSYRKEALDRTEEAYLRSLIETSESEVRKAMDISGLSQARLYGLLKKHGLQLKDASFVASHSPD